MVPTAGDGSPRSDLGPLWATATATLETAATRVFALAARTRRCESREHLMRVFARLEDCRTQVADLAGAGRAPAAFGAPPSATDGWTHPGEGR